MPDSSPGLIEINDRYGDVYQALVTGLWGGVGKHKYLNIWDEVIELFLIVFNSVC